MQRSIMKEEFDDALVYWAKAVIIYAQRNCTKVTAIQSIIKDVDLECKLSMFSCLFTVASLIIFEPKCN